MARVEDSWQVLRDVGVRAFAVRVWNEVLDDHLFIYSAALSYSWLFAIFPFLIFLLSLIAFLPENRSRFTGRDVNMILHASLPDQAADAIWRNIERKVLDLERPRKGVLSASLIIALWAASGGITVTMAALDKCYEIERPRAYIKRRPMAFLLTGMMAAIAFAVLMLLPVGTVLRAALRGHSHWLVVFDAARAALAVVCLIFALSLIYHTGPCVQRTYRFITPGAVFAIVSWAALGGGFGYYIRHFGKYGETYGGLGGVAVLLLIFYLDALVLLVGAEINSEIEYEVLKVPRGARSFRLAEHRQVHPA